MGILCPWWNTRRWWHGMAWHGIKCGRGIIDIKRRKKEKRNFKLENPNQNLRPETVIRDLKKIWRLRDDLQSSQNRLKHQDTMKKVHQLVIRTKNHDIRYCWNSWISRIHNWYELLAVSLFFNCILVFHSIMGKAGSWIDRSIQDRDRLFFRSWKIKILNIPNTTVGQNPSHWGIRIRRPMLWCETRNQRNRKWEPGTLLGILRSATVVTCS